MQSSLLLPDLHLTKSVFRSKILLTSLYFEEDLTPLKVLVVRFHEGSYHNAKVTMLKLKSNNLTSSRSSLGLNSVYLS